MLLPEHLTSIPTLDTLLTWSLGTSLAWLPAWLTHPGKSRGPGTRTRTVSGAQGICENNGRLGKVV